MRCDPAIRTWVLGAGGLLGSSVVRTMRLRGHILWSPGESIQWGSDGVAAQLARHAASFLAAGPGQARIVWCAGAAVTTARPEDLALEAAALQSVLDVVAGSPRPERVSLFFASSAGAVYAGCAGAPFDESTEPSPLAPYGRGKLAMEAQVAEASTASGMSSLVGRISNLYGPGQNLAKPQGLIAQLARALLMRQPTSIYVSTDTLRDHIFAPDCARLVADGLDQLERERADRRTPVQRTKVLASGRAVTVAHLVSELGRISRVRPLVVHGSSPVSAFQSRDLRLRSRVWPELDRQPLTALPVGIRLTLDALTLDRQHGRLV